VPLWTQKLQDFKDKKATLDSVISAVKNDRCSHEIRASQSNGAVFVLCAENLKNSQSCKECKKQLVVKMSKRAVYKSRNGGVSINEARVFREIKDAQSKLVGPFKEYKSHILQYVSHYSQPEDKEVILLSKFVKPTGPRNLAEFISSGQATQRDLEIIIIEVFMTLFVIRDIVPGFLHMDLLASQIFLTASDTVDTLPVNKKTNFVFGPRSYSTVIGDFGTSVTHKYPGAIEDYGFFDDLVNILQDAFRLFHDMIYLSKNMSKQKFLLTTANEVFKGRFMSLEKFASMDPYFYLPREAENESRYIHLHSYAEVVQRLPFIKKYIQVLYN